MSQLARRVARYRVRLGFPSAVLALWLAQPTERSLAARAMWPWPAKDCASGRRGISRKGARSRHPGRTVAASALSWLDHHRRRIRDCGRVCRGGVLVVVYLAITLTRRCAAEEAHLTENFGTAYPAFGRAASRRSTRRFSLTRVMRIASIEPSRGWSGACAAVVEGSIIVVFG